MRIHVRTQGFTSPNNRAFCFPLVAFRRQLREAGFKIRFYTKWSASLTDCDVLLLDSKVISPWWRGSWQRVYEFLGKMRAQVGCLVYMNIIDSSGWDHAAVLPHVDCFLKNQLLRDRTAYLKSWYGNRVYADYAHREHGVVDATPEFSMPIGDPGLLDRLAIGWNSGLADYGLLGQTLMSCYQRCRIPWILRFPSPQPRPARDRLVEVHGRMGTKYARATVAWQRLRAAELLGDRVQTDKLGRMAFLRELVESQIAVSPFGLGEITLKDFEVFRAGSCLIKPDCSHFETWPNFFENGVTYAPCEWGLDDLDSVIRGLLDDGERRLAIAAAGQRRYRDYTASPGAGDRFVSHFADCMNFACRWRRF